MGIPQIRTLDWVVMPSSRRSSQPRSPTLQANSLPAEPPGKPKNTGVGSLSLLQGNFLTQESNRGLPALPVDPLPAELVGKSRDTMNPDTGHMITLLRGVTTS